MTVFFIDIIINLLRPFRTSLKKLEIETPTDGKNVPVSNKNILEEKEIHVMTIMMMAWMTCKTKEKKFHYKNRTTWHTQNKKNYFMFINMHLFIKPFLFICIRNIKGLYLFEFEPYLYSTVNLYL